MFKSKFRSCIPVPKNLEQANSVIELLLDTIEAQQAELDALNDQRATNSRNSSKAPSSDSPSDRKQRPSKKGKSGKKQGAQPGHKGHRRSLVEPDKVDAVHHWYPGQCACGGQVSLNNLEPRRHQIIELPEQRVHVTEHRLHHGQCCHCGRKQCARLPAALHQTPFGARLHATIALLSGDYHLSTQKIQCYLKTFWKLPISQGAIINAQQRLTPWLWPLCEQIRGHLRQSAWIHVDETTHWRKNEQRWMWVMATSEAAYFQTHYSRGKGAAENVIGEDFNQILISDRLGSYQIIPAERHQYCIAHLIRNFEKMKRRRGIDGRVGKKILALLRLLIRLDHRRQKGLDVRVFNARAKRIKRRLIEWLERGSKVCRKRSRGQCEKLLKDVDRVFTFIKHPGLPLTNNEAERALRPYVIWRKTSFSSKSGLGDRFRATILSVIESCKRQGTNALEVLYQVSAQGLSGGEITASVFAENMAIEVRA